MTGYETVVRDCAHYMQTPQVKRLVALCEAGTITWQDAAAIMQDALAKALATRTQ